ncbi:MAG: nickel pincer cofactor biosynthesis protein LarC [Methanobrevibacter sp.]|nr:nickel pincer cofactor biosynthesis protein LarC [Methanobrevibacter sp.]
MVLIIDPQNAGIAGNMIAGAFVDLGVNPNKMKEVMENVANEFCGVKVDINRVNKSGIETTYLAVETCKEDNQAISFKDLLLKIENIEVKESKKINQLIPKEVFEISKKVFERIAISEAKIHGKTLEEVHFHEVGAADAVADVFGSIFGYCTLGYNNPKEKVIGLPIALGGGTIESNHGRIPVPAPAVMEMLKGVNCFGGPVATELATPTGVAIYLEICDEFKEFQPMIKPLSTGYGAGKKDFDFPNVLRIIQSENIIETQFIEVLETNIDHLSGETIGFLFEKLMNMGARDVAIVPIIMKKNRPGHLLKVISKKEDTDKLVSTIFRETGTLGIRVSKHTHRGLANRKIISLDVDINGKVVKIRFKIACVNDEIISSRAEYEDLKKIAIEMDIPLKNIEEIANDEIQLYLKRNREEFNN